MDRRALFFATGALVATLLYPLAPPDYRWVTLAVAAVYALLAAAFALDAWSRDRAD
jgi:hypothetical protein